jgi:hypothetical protein
MLAENENDSDDERKSIQYDEADQPHTRGAGCLLGSVIFVVACILLIIGHSCFCIGARDERIAMLLVGLAFILLAFVVLLLGGYAGTIFILDFSLVTSLYYFCLDIIVHF